MHISNASHGVHDPAEVLVLYLGNKFFGKVILDALKRVTNNSLDPWASTA